GLGRIVLSLVPIAVMTRPNDAGIGLPAIFWSAGLGSYRSMWLGPPSMKRKITLFALAAKCDGFGASGLSGETSGAPLAARPSRPSRWARAKPPKPQPARRRKSRREWTGRM